MAGATLPTGRVGKPTSLLLIGWRLCADSGRSRDDAGATGFDPQPHVQDLASGWWAAVAEDIRTPVSQKMPLNPDFRRKLDSQTRGFLVPV